MPPKSSLDTLRKAKPRRLEELIVTKQELGGTWQDYAWWWFLCHLLENNPNYTAQFRALGLELLTGKDTGFRQAFGAKIKELTFEYDFFLAHLQNGYRVDLCAWEWNRKFFGTTAGRTVMAQVQAGRGWQPSGLIVAAGANYAYRRDGNVADRKKRRAGRRRRKPRRLWAAGRRRDERLQAGRGVLARQIRQFYRPGRWPPLFALRQRLGQNRRRFRPRRRQVQQGRPAVENAGRKIDAPPKWSTGASARIDGRECLYFAGTGYLGLQGRPEVIGAACDAVRQYGIGSANSRTAFGTTPPLLEVERRAARMFGLDDAFYYASGWMGNNILMQSLQSPGPESGLVLIDEHAHYSIIEAARLTGWPQVAFHHCDPDDVRARLKDRRKSGEAVMLLSDGVFAATGRIAPAAEYYDVLRDCPESVLCLDDAHGVGVLGENGRGTFEHAGLWRHGVNTIGDPGRSPLPDALGNAQQGRRRLRRNYSGRPGIHPPNQAAVALFRRGQSAAHPDCRRHRQGTGIDSGRTRSEDAAPGERKIA